MMMNKPFAKTVDGSFGRSIECRGGKFVSSVYSQKHKALPFA